MTSNAAIVFRVLGIPPDASIASLGAVLAEQFSGEGIALDARKTTICSSCYSDGTQTALVQFVPNPPAALMAFTNGGGYDIEFGDSGRAIYVDKDFYGLTPLYAVPGDIEADIVAVSGLNGHAYGSWRGRNNIRPMWLRHYLSRDFPKCRTMTYGYNSKLTAMAIHTTGDFTKSFLEELNKSRRSDEEKKRPIVFIGHSFGGIIIAQALVKAKGNIRDHGALFQSTRAAIFFGTPHRGLLVDDILAMVGEGSPRVALVNSISSGSNVLKTELEKFFDCSASLRIVSFYETMQTRKLVKGPDGRWTRSGDHFTFVEESSSVLRPPRDNEVTLPAEGDHSTMVKFGYKEHSSYTSVTWFLRDLSFGAPAKPRAKNGNICPYQAVITGDVNALARLFQSPDTNLDVNMKCALDTTTLLHIAVMKRDKMMVALLLESGADMEIVNELGYTALHSAIRTGNAEIVQFLVQGGADITATWRQGVTALHFAAVIGEATITGLLLTNGADITATMLHEYTALHIAGMCGNAEVVAMLLNHGAPVEASDKSGSTALHYAAVSGYEKVVEVLLQYAAKTTTTNCHDVTPLHLAARGGYEKAVEVLLNYHADTEAKYGSGFTPLHFAVEAGFERVAELLLQRGANIMATAINNITLLHVAIFNRNVNVIKVLLNYLPDVEARTKDGTTGLIIAARDGDQEVVRMLLRAGASVAAENNRAETALDTAIINGHAEVVAILLQHGAARTLYSMSAALALATKAGHQKVVELLTGGIPAEDNTEMGGSCREPETWKFSWLWK